MGKFRQTISAATDNLTDEQLVGVKNPYQSQNPFPDGMSVEFEGFVIVSWQHDDYGSGKYVAIKFKDFKAPLALASLTKDVTAFKDRELKESADFTNVGGLAKVLQDHLADGGITQELLTDIKKFFESGTFKIKLTYYYNRKFSNVKRCSLTNVIKTA